MKKFTLILALVTFAISGFAQTSAAWQNKIQKQKAKNELALKQIAMLSNLSGISTNSTSDPYSQLKSAGKQKLDSIVSWESDDSPSGWKYDEKVIYEYDNQMRTLRWLENDWKDDTKMWKTEDKTEFAYGTDGKLSSMIMFSTDDVSGQLIPYTKTELYYKPDGKVDSLLSYSDEPKGTWTLDVKQYYHYDASGRMIRWELWMIQDDEDEPNFGAWIKGGIFKFEYDSSGRIVKQESFYEIEGDEIIFARTVHVYNTSGQLESSEDWSLNFLTFLLEKNELTTYQYNTEGDISVEIDSKWDATGQKWVEEYKYENTYGTLSSSDVIYPNNEVLFLAIGDPSIKMPNKAVASDKTFEKVGGNWVQTDKSTYYYSAASSTLIDELAKPSLSFYPNPASENITLQWKDKYVSLNLQVFQINGAKVLDKIVYSDEKVSVAHLVKGMYLLKLLDGRENVYTGKLVKN